MMTREEAERMLAVIGKGEIEDTGGGIFCIFIATRKGYIVLGENGWEFCDRDGESTPSFEVGEAVYLRKTCGQCLFFTERGGCSFVGDDKARARDEACPHFKS